MVDFSDRTYTGKDGLLYNELLYKEVLNKALQLLKENPMGFAILKGANYKDVVDKATYDEAAAKMRGGKEAGFAVETVYIGFFDKDKGSPEGARCYLAMPNYDVTDREKARGEVYVSPVYVQGALDAFDGDKETTALFLANILAHEFTHGNQETQIINEVSDSASALSTDLKKNDPNRRDGAPKDRSNESWVITEANSDTAGFMILRDMLQNVSAEKKEKIVDKYLEVTDKFSWVRTPEKLESLKNMLLSDQKTDAVEVYSLLVEERLKKQGEWYYTPPTFDKESCQKWAKICYQAHLFEGQTAESLAEKTIDVFSNSMQTQKAYMQSIISPEWLSEIHPKPALCEGTNAKYLFDHFYEEVQGKDKNKMPTDDEIRAQADKYFKEFGIEGFADTFMQEAAYAHVADSKIKTYTDIIKQNAESLTELKNKATCVQNEDGSWGIKIKEEEYIQGHHVIETREIQVKKELADEIFAVYLEKEMKNEATYLLYETEYKKEHPDFDYQTASKEEQATFKREAIEWFKNEPDQHTKEVEQYLALHRNEMLKPIEEKLLKEKVLEQVVVNYATSKTIENADKETYQSAKDIGHCSKSVLTYMYQLQKQNGGYAFLPEDPNVAAQPVQLFEHFSQNYPNRVQKIEKEAKVGPTDINRAFKSHQPPYEEGTLALIDNGHGRHLMMYRGLNHGEPEFVGFNPLAERQVLLNQKAGEIIDIPSLIRDETRGVLVPPQKQVEAEKLQTTEGGRVAIDMTVSRTADGEQIKGFEGQIDIPNPIRSEEQNTIQNTNKDNMLAQTILEKTGRPSAKRKMPRVKTETKKELKKLGFWNMFKKNKNRGA